MGRRVPGGIWSYKQLTFPKLPLSFSETPYIIAIIILIKWPLIFQDDSAMASHGYMRIEGKSQGLISAGCSCVESIGNRCQVEHTDEIMV